MGLLFFYILSIGNTINVNSANKNNPNEIKENMNDKKELQNIIERN